MSRWIVVVAALLAGACAAPHRGASAPLRGTRLSASRAMAPASTAAESEVGLSLNWIGVTAAKPSCSGADEFSKQVSSRLRASQARLWSLRLQRDLEVRVTVAVLGDAWRGAVRLRGAVEAERRVVGQACGEVVEALALITALRVREASASPRRSESAKPPAVADSETPSEVDTGQAASRESPSRVKIALLGGIVSAPVPSAEVSLRGDLWRAPHWHSWMWSGALAYQRGNRGRFHTSAASVQLDACSPSLVRGLWLRACSFGRVGVQRVSASRSPMGSTTPSQTLWGAMGLGVHTEFRIQGPWSARPFVEVFVTSSRNEYFIAGIGEDGGLVGADVASFTSPRFGARSGLGLSYEL